LKKNVFIGAISGTSIKSPVVKQFVDDLKYSIDLKFGADSTSFSEQDSGVDVSVNIVPKDGKIEKNSIELNKFYINFSNNLLELRNRFYIDLSEYLDNQEEEFQQEKYWNAITDIVFQIEKHGAKDHHKTAYVAEASSDQIENRKSIVRELEQNGFNIVPAQPIGKNAGADIKKALDAADFSIHIIGENEVIIEEGEDKDLVFLQNELASSHSSAKKEFKRYIYIPSNINPPKTQLVKIEKVKRKPANLIGAEIIESGIEKFKSELFQKIYKVKARHEIVDMQGNLLYIINGVNFKSETKSIRKQLEDTSIDLVAIDSFDDSLDFLHQHKANLLQASSILIINSEENNHWLSSMLDDVLKSYGFGKQRAFDLIGIITKQKLQYFSQLELINFVEIQDSTSKPSGESIRSFLNAVKDARD
jgi:hypothetical protein